MSNTASQAKKNAPDEGAGKHEQLDSISGGTNSSSRIAELNGWEFSRLPADVREQLLPEEIGCIRPECLEYLSLEQLRYVKGESLSIALKKFEHDLLCAESRFQEISRDLSRKTKGIQESWSTFQTKRLEAEAEELRGSVNAAAKRRDMLRGKVAIFIAEIERRKQAEAELKAAAEAQEQAQAEAERARWLSSLTPEDVAELATDDLFTVTPDLLAHVTVSQVERIGADRRKDFTPEQHEALAGRFAEVDELRRQRDRERMEAKQREREAQEQAELDELLEDLGGFDLDDDVLDEEPEGVDCVVNGMTPVSYVTFVYGDTDTGKSTFVRAVAMGAARGYSPFPSMEIDGAQAGVYLIAEDGGKQFRDGARAQAPFMPGPTIAELKVLQSRDTLMVDEDGEWVPSKLLNDLNELFSRKNYRYLVVDHLSRFARNFRLKCDDDIRPLMDALTTFAEDHEVAVIVLHHSKDTSKGWQNKTGMLGGPVLKQQSRSIVRVERSGFRTKVIHEKYNYGLSEKTGKPAIYLEWVGAALREVTSEKAPDATQVQEATQAADPGPLLLEWMTDHPEAKIPLAALLQGKGGDAEAMLDHLRAQIPGMRNGEAHAAAQSCIDAGTLVLAETKINRKTRMVLAVP